MPDPVASPPVAQRRFGQVFRALVILFRRAGWAPFSILLFHGGSSEVLALYERFAHFDVVTHILGGASVAFLYSVAFAALPADIVRRPIRGALEAVVTLALTGTTAVLWEFVEFFADRYLGTRTQVGLRDTLLDLAMGLVGGIAVVLVAWGRGLLGRFRPLEPRGPGPAEPLQRSRVEE